MNRIQRNCKVIEPDIEKVIISNKGTKAIISKLINKAKVYEQCFDFKSLIYNITFDFWEKVIFS